MLCSKINSMAKLFSSHLFKNLVSETVRKSTFHRAFHRSPINMIKVGEAMPPLELLEGIPGNPINMAEFCQNKKIVLFGVPGAFTPGCSKTHLPGFIERYLEFKRKGVDEIICVSVNDVFVMEAWGKAHQAGGKVRMFADPDATFTKALGLEIELPKLGGIRSKRYAMVIVNGVIKILNVEPDGTGLTCSLAPKLQI